MKTRKKNEKLLIFLLKMIKIFYSEWYNLCKDKYVKQEIYLKGLNINIF